MFAQRSFTAYSSSKKESKTERRNHRTRQQAPLPQPNKPVKVVPDRSKLSHPRKILTNKELQYFKYLYFNMHKDKTSLPKHITEKLASPKRRRRCRNNSPTFGYSLSVETVYEEDESSGCESVEESIKTYTTPNHRLDRNQRLDRKRSAKDKFESKLCKYCRNSEEEEWSIVRFFQQFSIDDRKDCPKCSKRTEKYDEDSDSSYCIVETEDLTSSVEIATEDFSSSTEEADFEVKFKSSPTLRQENNRR